MYKNFSIKSSKGVFYQSSKEPKEGFVATETQYGTKFHQERKEVSGVLIGVEIVEPPFGGYQLNIKLEDGDDINVIQQQIFDAKDETEDWIQEICKFLPNLNLGDKLVFALNRSKKNDKDHLWKNMYVTQDGDKVDWAFDKSEVPPLVKTKNRAGKEVTDAKARSDWYYDLLKVNVDRLAMQKDSKQEPVAEEEDSEIPF